jgi:hypothetical protein
MLYRQCPVGVIQICWIAPGPAIFATSNTCPGSIRTNGETFHPGPRSRALLAAGPSVDMPPFPFSPVKFSAEIERVFARDKRERLPRFRPKPLKSAMVFSSTEYSALAF